MTLILIQMYPSLLGLVAIYGILTSIGRVFPPLGLDSLIGLIMVYLGGSLGGGTYLMYGFFNTVPKEIDEAAKLWLADKGYDPKMGARPMARVIQEQIKRPLAEELLFGKLTNGGKVFVRLGDEGLKFDIEGREKTSALEHV